MRNDETTIKIWFNKKEILNHYPIGTTTYKRRIKKLRELKYSNYTRLVIKDINESNLKKTIERQIHFSVLNELFGNVRTPKLTDTNQLIKWINLNKWDWFCNIIPSKTYPFELKYKMNYFFNELKKNKNILSRPVIFYTIEKNSEDEYYHSHFLIKTGESKIDKTLIESLLNTICEPNTTLETRIFVRPYNYKLFQDRGSKYSSKDTSVDYNLLK